MDIIRDGRSNDTLHIDNKNRASTYSVTETEDSFINRVEREMYHAKWTDGLQAATADNYILYLKNTSDTKDLVISFVEHRCEDANGTMVFYINVSGTPGGSLTTLTPANKNSGSNNVADCEYYSSSNITGVSNGREIGDAYGKAGEEFKVSTLPSGYILTPNGTFAVKANNTTAKHYGSLEFYFRDQN